MSKVLGISIAVLLIFYKFFGLKAILVLLAIIVALLTLVYFNQNKILYIPRTSQSTQLSPTLRFLPRATRQDGGIPLNREFPPRMFKFRLQMDSGWRVGFFNQVIVGDSSSTSTKMLAVIVPLCRSWNPYSVPQKYNGIHWFQCPYCRL